VAKGKSRPVLTKRPKDVLKDGKLVIGVITVEKQRKMRKAKEREERIASGIKLTGAGVHGDSGKSKKTERNRRERREAKQNVRITD